MTRTVDVTSVVPATSMRHRDCLICERADDGSVASGRWSTDASGRACFDVDVDRCPGDAFHLVGAPGLAVLVYVSGELSIFSTVGGMVRIAEGTALPELGPVGTVPVGQAPTALRLLVDGVEMEWATDRATLSCTVTADPDEPSVGFRWRVRPVSGEACVCRVPFDLANVPLIPAPLMSRRIAAPATIVGADRLAWRAAFAASDRARRGTDRLRRRWGERHPLIVTIDRDRRRAVWAPTRPRVVRDRPQLFLGEPPTVRLELTDPPDRRVAAQAALHLRASGSGSGPGNNRAAGGNRVGSGAGCAVLAVECDGPVDVRAVLRVVNQGRPAATRARAVDKGFGVESASVAAASVVVAASAAGEGVRERLGARGAPGSAGSDPRSIAIREAPWHLAMLRGLRVPDPAVGHDFVMQGSAYGFIHGLHGAVRDEAFVVAAIADLDADLAREALCSMAAMSLPSGMFGYAHFGSGAQASGGVHASPTDLPLFFLWALAEFVETTHDTTVLDVAVRRRASPLLRPGRRRSTGSPDPTIAQVAAAAARAVERHVGFGPHGLLRVGSGDWADPISLMVANRRAFHRHGESVFNSAMAVAVLPRVADVLDRVDRDAAAICRNVAASLVGPLDDAWTGRWYLRAWDGAGGPVGVSHCFLDAQVWPLIAGHGPADRRDRLVASVLSRLDEPSTLGPTIIDRPHRIRGGLLAPGWDCNGGVWAALGGLAVWAVAERDSGAAWRMLHRQSMLHRGRVSPQPWVGHWSGPDCLNSWMGADEGGTFVHPATPMAEFPSLNSNAHAGPLLGLRRLLEFEAGATRRART